jgi:uncharacterized protein
MNEVKAPRSRRGFFAAGGAALVAAALATHAPAALAQAAGGKARLVLQVSDGDPMKWNLALNNAKNVQSDYGGTSKVDIEIVAYGPGIGMLKMGSQVGERVSEAMKAGIHVVACENTMQNLKLTKADMLSDIGYAPSGVVELMKKQQQGWAYVRP